MVRILHCGCKHEAQDKMYGRGKRLHNDCDGRTEEYRCTVCGTQHGLEKKRGSFTPVPKGARVGGKKSGKKGCKQRK